MAKPRRASEKDVKKAKAAPKKAAPAPAKSATKKVAKVPSKKPPARPSKPPARASTPPKAKPSAPPKAKPSSPPKAAAKPSSPPKAPARQSTPPKAAAPAPKPSIPVKPPARASVPPLNPKVIESKPPPRRAESVRPSEIPDEPSGRAAALIRSPELENPIYIDARQRELEGMAVSAHPSALLTPKQVEELHKKLLVERARVLAGQERHLQEALEDPGVLPDETDMAQRSTEQAYLIRFADKERKLLNEIEHALDKMKVGEYGVCEGTDEAIGFKRLELRPWTRYSVAFKEQMERERSQHRR
jgi:DnaK suppressor protein